MPPTPDRLPTHVIALVATMAGVALALRHHRCQAQQHPPRRTRYRPLGTSFPAVFIGIGACFLHFFKNPRFIFIILISSLVIYSIYYHLAPETRQQLHCWIVDGPISTFVHVAVMVLYKARWTWVPALTAAGLHGPVYLSAKGITMWYESFVFPVAIVFSDPQIGVFAIAAFTTWRLLERKARGCLRHLRALIWQEIVFISHRLLGNFIARVPGLRNFVYDFARLLRTIEVEMAAH